MRSDEVLIFFALLNSANNARETPCFYGISLVPLLSAYTDREVAWVGLYEDQNQRHATFTFRCTL
ncbi:hypothetical protein L63ED372_01199 [Limnohabitans sp. 63ED37-2]|nr:hypothetical protein L63ED372_01199 [Limnohabitans sp. 63ED37-2]